MYLSEAKLYNIIENSDLTNLFEMLQLKIGRIPDYIEYDYDDYDEKPIYSNYKLVYGFDNINEAKICSSILDNIFINNKWNQFSNLHISNSAIKRTYLDYWLLEAAKSDSSTMVQFLLASGANPNICDGDRWSALAHAVYNGNTDVVKILLVNKNIDVGYIVDYRSAFDIAQQRQFGDIIQLFYEYNAIFEYARDGSTDYMIEYLRKEPRTDAFINKANDAFLIALRNGNAETAMVLIDYGVDIHVEYTDEYNNYENAVLCAIKGNCNDILNMLLDHGVKVESEFLYEAISMEHIELFNKLLQYYKKNNDINDLEYIFNDKIINGMVEYVKILIENGININMVFDRDGYTPLTLAVKNGKLNIVRILLSNNVDIKQPDKNGKTAIEIAKDKNDNIIMFELKKYLKTKK